MVPSCNEVRIMVFPIDTYEYLLRKRIGGYLVCIVSSVIHNRIIISAFFLSLEIQKEIQNLSSRKNA